MNVPEPSGDPEGEGSDDLTGRKKSRLKSLKSRLFGKIRRKEDDGGLKQSQSESDITWGVEDSDCPIGMLGTRAFSHDSIFQAEQGHSDPEPLRILSQENIHGKIRALQVKLQQQKMHLGPPPLMLPIKHREDLGGSSEEDVLPRSPPEGLSMSISNKVPVLSYNSSMLCDKSYSIPPKNYSTFNLGGTGGEDEEQASSQPLSPQPISPAPLYPLTPGSVVDFTNPPQVTSLLDNSAARHRMSLKPKNQRASAKNKRVITSGESRTRCESLNYLDRSFASREEEEGLTLVKEIPRARSYSSEVLRPREKLTATHIKSHPVSPVMSQQAAGDGRQVSAEPQFERNVLSTSPPSPSLRGMPPSESPVAKLPISVVPIDRKGKEVSEIITSSKPLKISQTNLVSNLRSNMTTTPEQSLVNDEKKSNTVLIQNKMDTLSKYSVQSSVNIESRQASTHAPASVICGVTLRPSSLRRNVPSTDEKHEPKILHPVSTVAAVSQEGSQTETTRRQRTVSGSFHSNISSDKNQERPRTASFTGVVGQAGLKKEATEPTEPTDPTLNFKTERLVISQAEKTVKDPCTNFPLSSKKEDLVTPTKFIDLSKTSPQTLDAEMVQDNEKEEIRVEATEEGVHEVEVAEEAGEDVMEDAMAGNAFGVKLRSTSLSLKFRLDKAKSEDKARHLSFEISPQIPPLAPQSDCNVKPEDQRTGTGSIRGHVKHKDPPVRTDESSISVQCSRSPPKSKDKERAGFFRQAEPLQPSTSACKDAKIVPSPNKEGADLPPEETTPVSSPENPPTSTASEVSWMEMAREKTRSLQQLFTSRLPEFPSLQSRPTSLTTTQPQTQTSTSQANPRTSQNITSQSTATQPPLRPSETKQPSGRSTQSTALLTQMQTQTRTTSQPLASLTSQSETESTREAQFQSKTTTKPTESTVTCTSNAQSTIHTAKQPSQTWAPQTPPIPQSSPLRAASQTPTQAILRPTPPPGPPNLSSSPKLTSHLVSQQSTNTISKDQPQNEGGEPTTISGKADRASVLQERGTGHEDVRPIWAAGLGKKTLLVQRWESQTTAGIKTGEQKATSESRTTSQSTVPLRPVSKVSGTGFDSSLSMQASVASVPGRSADREEKWQQKSVPPSSPSSSSPLQSVRDSGQPSWMELAKRKSLAWSDKTMD